VIGIRADKALVDGGILTQPEYAGWYPGEGWTVENEGVTPDIIVENRPQDLAQGKDRQLDKAIEELWKLHAESPPLKPEWGPPPTKTRDAFKDELE
jgi:tricorn protease